MLSRASVRSICAIGLTALLLATGCGDDSGGSGSSASSTTSDQPQIKVGLVTDIGGLNDRSFNSLANQGVEQAKSELGVQTRVITSKSNADYVPNLSSLAQQRYDLVIAVGFLMAEATETVAKKFPNTKFAIIDVAQSTMKSKPANVQGLIFKENEAGYLAGYLAGLYAKDNQVRTISSVGGQKIPPVDAYIAGYRAGAEKANPGLEVLNGYSQDFVDQAKCKEIALSQIERGSGVVFQVAGQCGLGALDAAKQEGKQGIGVDADQSFLGDYILTSAMKNVDQAVFETVKSVQADQFEAGTDRVFDLKSDGVGLGKVSAAGQKYTSQVEEIEQQIKSGGVQIPNTVD